VNARWPALAAALLQATLDPLLLALWTHWLPYDYSGYMGGRVAAVSVAGGTIAGVAAACAMTSPSRQRHRSGHSAGQTPKIAVTALLAGCLAAFAVSNAVIAEAGLWHRAALLPKQLPGHHHPLDLVRPLVDLGDRGPTGSFCRSAAR
jgi:hypothetical protein